MRQLGENTEGEQHVIMAASAEQTSLFAPVRLGSLELKNRFAMAPMTRRFSPNGLPGDDVVAYYSRRAESLGLIITEGVLLDIPSAGRSPKVPVLGGERPIEAWARVVDGVHAVGGRIICQLWHRGPAAEPELAITPSGLDNWSRPLGEPMTTAQIDEVVASYARGAADAKAAGFDGVEIHGAHGYLIDAFMWTGTNFRTDGYGGGSRGRTRLAVEVIRAVREATGRDFLVSFRFSQWKTALYGARIAETPAELEHLLAPIAEAGPDVLHASTRRFWDQAFDGSDRTLAGWARELTGLPTIAVGSVGLDGAYVRPDGAESRASERPVSTDVTKARELFDNGEFDVLAVGRALIANPDWVRRVRDQDADIPRAFSHVLADNELY